MSAGPPLLGMVLFNLLSGGCSRLPSPAPVETIRLSCRGRALDVEVASDPEARARGLMFRRTLPENGGMLFITPGRESAGFWMKNTFLPLSIAFLDDSSRIVNIADMQPFDEVTAHRPAVPVPYALEVSRGWFAANGIGPGDLCSFRLPERLVVR